MQNKENDSQAGRFYPGILKVVGSQPLLAVSGELLNAPGVAPKIVGGVLAATTATVTTSAGAGAELGKSRGLGGAGMIAAGGDLLNMPGIVPKIAGGVLVSTGGLLAMSAGIDADLGKGSAIRTIKSIGARARTRFTSRRT